MPHISSILVLADLSANSKTVMASALYCAHHFNSTLYLYHASPNLKGESQIEDLKQDFETKLEDLISELGFDKVKSQVFIAAEDFPSGLLLKQLITDVDLVIIGGGKVNSADVKREKVVRIVDSCSQPVMIIPDKRTLSHLSQILYSSSYRELSNNEPLDYIKMLAAQFKAEVRLAHVKTHDGEPNKEHAKRSRFEGTYFEPDIKYSYKLIRNSDVIEGISMYIRKKGDNDLLVMVRRRKHHIFDRVFGKNFTFRMLQQTEIPLLIIKETQLN